MKFNIFFAGFAPNYGQGGYSALNYEPSPLPAG